MATLFARRALLATGWAENVRITIADGHIARLVPDCEREVADEPVGLVLPGIANAHSHAFQRALLGRTEHRTVSTRDTFWTWRQEMYRLAEHLAPDDLSHIARQLYTEMLMSGYTQVAEFHYLHGVGTAFGPNDMRDALLAAANATGIRLLYVPVFYEQADFLGKPLAREQERFGLSLDAFLEHLDDSVRAAPAPHAVGVAAHSLRAVSGESLDVLIGALGRGEFADAHSHRRARA